MDQDGSIHPDEYYEWWTTWAPDGAGATGRFDVGHGSDRPACERCRQPVEWRHLRWAPVGQGGRVVVKADLPAWHPECRRRSAVASLGRDLVHAGRVVRDVGQAVLPALEGLRLVAVAVVPVVRPVVAGLGRDGREVVRLYGDAARRRVRQVRADEYGRSLGQHVGAAIELGLDVERTVRVARSGGVGWRRAWRAVRHRHDAADVVVAGSLGEWFRRGAGPIEWSTAGEAGPAGPGWIDEPDLWRALGQDDPTPFQRHYLDQWYGNNDAGRKPGNGR